jgi:phage gpG-like protein
VAGASIRIDDDGLEKALGAIVEAGRNPQPALEEIGVYAVKSTRGRFFEEQGPGGLPWLPSIRRQREGGRTLTASGRLRGDISYQAGPDFVEWGTAVIYGGVHQFGATIRPKTAKALVFEIPGVGWVTRKEVTIPARPFLGVDDADREAMGEILVHWLEEAASARGEGSP